MNERIKALFFRNNYTINKEKAERNRINLEYWKRTVNIGDTLAPVIYEWVLEKKHLQPDIKINKTIHLLSIGSILAEGKIPVNAVVWGTGVHCFQGVRKLAVYRKVCKLDIRAVRGPVTKHILDCCGYKCPDTFGDPGILMPLIYLNNNVKKIPGKVSLIRHFKSADLDAFDGIHKIDTRTDDYKAFIDDICSSEKVISSSLHGIILAESYGVPAVFLQENMEKELIKYYDWYYSTGRKNIRMAYSVEEALNMEPMELPKLNDMQEKLLKSFPYDLWE